jgi:hypothetical protein
VEESGNRWLHTTDLHLLYKLKRLVIIASLKRYLCKLSKGLGKELIKG